MIAQGRLLTGLAYLGASPIASLVCFMLLFALVSGYATEALHLLSSWIAPWVSPRKHASTITIQDNHRDQRNRSPTRKQHQKRPHRKHSGSGSGFASSGSTSLGLPSHAAPPQQLGGAVQFPHHQQVHGKSRPRTLSSPPSPPACALPPTLSSVAVDVASSVSTLEFIDSFSSAKRPSHIDSPKQAVQRTAVSGSPTTPATAVPSKSTGKRASNSSTRPASQDLPSTPTPSSSSPMTTSGPRHRRSRSSRSSHTTQAQTEPFNPSPAESVEFAKVTATAHKPFGELTEPAVLSASKRSNERRVEDPASSVPGTSKMRHQNGSPPANRCVKDFPPIACDSNSSSPRSHDPTPRANNWDRCRLDHLEPFPSIVDASPLTADDGECVLPPVPLSTISQSDSPELAAGHESPLDLNEASGPPSPSSSLPPPPSPLLRGRSQSWSPFSGLTLDQPIGNLVSGPNQSLKQASAVNHSPVVESRLASHSFTWHPPTPGAAPLPRPPGLAPSPQMTHATPWDQNPHPQWAAGEPDNNPLDVVGRGRAYSAQCLGYPPQLEPAREHTLCDATAAYGEFGLPPQHSRVEQLALPGRPLHGTLHSPLLPVHGRVMRAGAAPIGSAPGWRDGVPATAALPRRFSTCATGLASPLNHHVLQQQHQLHYHALQAQQLASIQHQPPMHRSQQYSPHSSPLLHATNALPARERQLSWQGGVDNVMYDAAEGMNGEYDRW